MAYVSHRWDLDTFQKLCEEAFGKDYTAYSVSREIGIGLATCRLILLGKSVPQFSTIVKIADYFAVPVDILIGRCSADDYNKLMRDYCNSFRLLRRYDYEEKLTKELTEKAMEFVPKTFSDNDISGSWPYNLLDILIQGHWPCPITDDQDQGIVYALSLLSDREVDVIIKRFVEEKTLEASAKDLNLTRERVRQIQHKAVCKLRHPARFNSILYGKSGNEERSGLCVDINALKRERKSLEEDISRLRDLVQEEADAIRYGYSHRIKLEALGIKYHTSVYKPPVSGVENLDLSIRAFNCLKRANCNTIEDVIELAKKGELTNIRNFGRVSLIEVLSILKDRFNEDLFSVYGLDQAEGKVS